MAHLQGPGFALVGDGATKALALGGLPHYCQTVCSAGPWRSPFAILQFDYDVTLRGMPHPQVLEAHIHRAQAAHNKDVQ